jgi:hypothetical protein
MPMVRARTATEPSEMPAMVAGFIRGEGLVLWNCSQGFELDGVGLGIGIAGEVDGVKVMTDDDEKVVLGEQIMM